MIFNKWFKHMVMEHTDINPPNITTMNIYHALKQPQNVPGTKIDISRLMNEVRKEYTLKRIVR